MDEFILSVACNLLGNDTVYSKLSDNDGSSTIASGSLETATAVGTTYKTKTTPTKTLNQKSRLLKHNNSRFRYGQEQQKQRKNNNIQVLSAPSESNKTTNVKNDTTGEAKRSSDNCVLYWRSPVLLNQNKKHKYSSKVNEHLPQHEIVEEECNSNDTCQSLSFVDVRFDFGTVTLNKHTCDKNELIRMRIGLMLSNEKKDDSKNEYDEMNTTKTSVRTDEQLSFSYNVGLVSKMCAGTYIMSEPIRMHVLKNHILSLSVDWDSTPVHVLAQLFANALQNIGVIDLNENTCENEEKLSYRQCSISNILVGSYTNKTTYDLHLQYKDFGQVSNLKFVHHDTSGSTDFSSNITSRNDDDDDIIHCTLSAIEPFVMDMILQNLQHQDRHGISTSSCNNNNDNNISSSHSSSSVSYEHVLDVYEKWKNTITMKQQEEQEQQQCNREKTQQIGETSNPKILLSDTSPGSMSLNEIDTTIAQQNKQQDSNNDTTGSTALVNMAQSSDVASISNENDPEKIANTSVQTITENEPTNVLTSTIDNTTASGTIVASSFSVPSSVMVQDAIESTNAKKNQTKRSQQQQQPQQRSQGRYSKISISQSTKRRKLQFTG